MKNFKKIIPIITVILMISIFYTSCTKDEVFKQSSTVETNDQFENTLSSRSSSEFNWCDLTAQQQADFARFLGRLWGDGLPSNTNTLTGSKFTEKSARHDEIYNRLKNVFDLPNNSNKKNMPNFCDYWVDALPGNNPGDPQIFREAIKNPNFIAGLIDSEGQKQHNGNNRYLIEDHTYAPSHPDQTKGWGLRNFGPNRIIQLFLLLEETYGFTNTKIKIGQNDEFTYAQKDQAIDKLMERYNNAKAMNEDLNLGSTAFTVKIFINQAHFKELRSYGYWEKEQCNNSCESANGQCLDDCKFRSPAPDDATLNILTGDFPDILMSKGYFKIWHKESNMVVNQDLQLVPDTQDDLLLWSMIDADDGYFRIVSKENCKWLKANNNMDLALVSDQKTGWQTKWKKQQLQNGNFYIINKKFKDEYLRANVGKTKVRLGVKGKQANWSLPSVN